MTGVFPLVRIGLYLLAGWLAGIGIDEETTYLIRTDPDLLALVVAGVSAVWYALAKWRGWKT